MKISLTSVGLRLQRAYRLLARLPIEGKNMSVVKKPKQPSGLGESGTG